MVHSGPLVLLTGACFAFLPFGWAGGSEVVDVLRIKNRARNLTQAVKETVAITINLNPCQPFFRETLSQGGVLCLGALRPVGVTD